MAFGCEVNNAIKTVFGKQCIDSSLICDVGFFENIIW